MTTEAPADTSFNPLVTTLADELVKDAQQSTVSNIRESYHGRMDSFAEAIQNAVDALEKRWATWPGPGEPGLDGNVDERPQIRVIIDCATNLVDVIDNGIGMEEAELRQALVPNVTFKKSDSTQRGQKGVGTTYLTYGHNLFAIATKTPTGTHAYELRDGLKWSQTSPTPDFPVFKPSPPLGHLADYGRGSAVRMQFGHGTNYGNLTGTFFNRPELWDFQLRSFTAIGLIRLGLTGAGDVPPWVAYTEITVDLRNTPGAGIRTLPFEFPYPHKALPQQDVAELQSLQNNPQTSNKYKLVYFSRSHAELLQLLQPELERLKEESERADADTAEAGIYEKVLDALKAGEIAAYASLAYTNRLYEDSFKQRINQPAAQRLPSINVKGGVLIASQHMVIGEVLSHLENYRTLRPEQRPRYFLMLHFNQSYRPDIGRKTIPQDKETVVGWLEAAIIRVLGNWALRLQVTNDDSTHNAGSFAQAQQILQQDTDAIINQNAGAPQLTLSGLVIARSARTEQEVVIQFVNLVSHGHLPGYKIQGVPGNQSRYDALFDVRLTTPAEELTGPPADFGIASNNFSNGEHLRSKKWLEFKLQLSSLIDEFKLSDGQPNKKYFEQVDLVVCGTATLPPGTADYELIPIGGSSRGVRNYPGSTHQLKKHGAEHAVEVVALSDLIASLSASTTG